MYITFMITIRTVCIHDSADVLYPGRYGDGALLNESGWIGCRWPEAFFIAVFSSRNPEVRYNLYRTLIF